MRAIFDFGGAALAALLSLTVSTAGLADPPLKAIYPGPLGPQDARQGYDAQMLDLALSHCGEAYELHVSPIVMGQKRSLFELAAGSDAVTVVPVETSVEREAKLLPIRIPLSKGLIGWRLALVPAEHPALLAQVSTLADLRHLTAGQGYDWPDADVLEQNGLSVLRVTDYDSLFAMLRLQRFDYFPRSIREIWGEAAARGADRFTVDTHLAIHYPSAEYFFVNRADTRLADAVRRGFEAAIRDGSFDRLFEARLGPLIAEAHLERRTIIELRNPDLPPETPLDRTELWFDPRQPVTRPD